MVEGKVLRRAGKKGGKYDKWWNVQNSETGQIEHVDLDNVSGLEIVSGANNADKELTDENVYVVGIPRYRHYEQESKG